MGSFRPQDTLAQTGPGVPDEALADGEAGLEDGSNAAIQRQADRLRAQGWAGKAMDETEAHPS